MTCAQMGGPKTCNFVVTGHTAEEMAKKGGQHVTASHPDIEAQMKNMSKGENDKWMADFKVKFDALPEM